MPLHLLHRGFNGKFISLNGSAAGVKVLFTDSVISSRQEVLAPNVIYLFLRREKIISIHWPRLQASALRDFINWALDLNVFTVVKRILLC
jgi:hypothetical protein